MEHNETYPFYASDAYAVRGNWTQVLFWSQFDKADGIPQRWLLNKITSAPVAIVVETICYVGTNLKNGKKVFAAALIFQFSAN